MSHWIFFNSFYLFSSLYKRQQEWINGWKDVQSQAYYGSNPNYAYASGAYGPNFIQQSAGIQPPNKVIQNFMSKL